MHVSPTFLDLPPRPSKPRTCSVTHVLDKGMPLRDLDVLLEQVDEFIDVWKFGWGTAYLDPHVEDKVSLLQERGILACTGGTLLEIAWAQGRADRLLSWAARAGFSCVEVSNGAVDMPAGEKKRLITDASDRFVVLAEVGSKDPAIQLSPHRWADEMIEDLDAGARWVIAEGRESGTVGLYRDNGAARDDVVSAVATRVGIEHIIFEAPRKDQQAWFIRLLGNEVNLGNIIPAETMGVEALRLGLRVDTIHLSCPSPSAAPGGS